MRAANDQPARPRRWTVALVLGSALILFAGAVAARPGEAAISLTTRPLQEPIELQPPGEFAHAASGFSMPQRVGPFARAAVTQFDEEGLDLGAGYAAVIGETVQVPVFATLYVYPRLASHHGLDEYFDRLLEDVGQHHGGAKAGFRENVEVVRGLEGRYAGLAYTERWLGSESALPLRSYLVLYAWGGWWVKWRVTTPAPIDGARMRAIVELTRAVVPPDTEPHTRIR
jgi:hypothetical protein